MKISTERLPQSQVALQIEVDDDRLNKAMASAYKRLAAKVRIPGFRPGKAPREVVERHLGEHAVFHEAVDRLMPQVYQEALEQEQIDPIDRAEYELVTEQPLVAKFTVPVRPTVDLGDYRSLRVEREPVVVEPERVQEALEGLRHRYATLEPVSRPIQWGDIVRAEVRAEVDGREIVREEDAEFALVEGRTLSLPGFSEAFIGKEKGAEFAFELSVPEDAPDEKLRGRPARYWASVKEVKQEVLPELDDEFARNVGEGFESLEALRSRIEDDLREALEAEAEHAYHDQVLDALAARAELDYPPVLIEREVDRMLQEQSSALQPSGRRGASQAEQLDAYLRQLGKSEEELRAELRPVAEERIRRWLVLSEVAEAEDIQVSDADVEAEIERLTSGVGSQGDELRRLFSGKDAQESLRRSLRTRKTLDRLVEIASAPETPAEAQATASSG